MTIPFSHLGLQPKRFDYQLDGEGFSVTLSGEIIRPKIYEMAKLTATLKGRVSLECDRCAATYEEAVDETVTFTLTDTPYKRQEGDTGEQDYDIIEFLDGNVDLDEIIISEINAIRYDYHRCEACQ